MLPEFKFAVREDLLDVVDEASNQNLFLPSKGEPDATGWDVRAAQADRKDIIIRPFEYCMIPLGFRAFCPKGWWYNLHPRSSSFVKKNMHCLIGTIDETYPKEVMLAFQFIPNNKIETKACMCKNGSLIIPFATPIAQIIPIERQEMLVTEISNEDIENLYQNRNSVRKGGFGSTS